MELLTDGVREADEDNPRGYFEFEPVKKTREDPSWVGAAVGKAVKMVTLLLRDLPPGFDYRVILMRRDAAEVLDSQRAMLDRMGRPGASAPPERLKELFSQEELARVSGWIMAQPNFRLLAVEHADCLTHPYTVASSLASFLGGNGGRADRRGVDGGSGRRHFVSQEDRRGFSWY